MMERSKLMGKRKYDFAGWVTKNDIRCSDGVVIRHGAFRDNDGKKVPLVWQHNHSDPTNVLGHIVLEHRDEGTYGYGYFNETDSAEHAKTMVKHGDIDSMSIGARKIKKKAQDVIHGMIYEVSLVLSGANPGAVILEHSDSFDDEYDDTSIIYTPLKLEHSEEEEDNMDTKELELEHAEKTVGDVLNTFSEEQMNALEIIVAQTIEELQGGTSVKHSVFDNEDTLEHSFNEGALLHMDFQDVMESAQKLGSLKAGIQHTAGDDQILHGITNIELLFPDAHLLDKTPQIKKDDNTGAIEILNATTKSPFSRLKTRYADFTEEEARARGYIKGAQKLEQIFSIAQRETTPQTVYKKQKLDRDDIVDITDFDVVAFINMEMDMMLREELGRAILVGDGRLVSSPDKIKEDKIRPIISDDALYTIKKEFTDEKDLAENVVLGMIDYKGSGAPTGYIDPTLLAKYRLQKGTDGRWLSGHILSNQEVASELGVSKLVPTTLMEGKGLLVVNLSDYTVGSTKGGEVTTFEDFDIDFNQHKYLIETRLCGALTKLHSAIHFKPKAPVGD